MASLIARCGARRQKKRGRFPPESRPLPRQAPVESQPPLPIRETTAQSAVFPTSGRALSHVHSRPDSCTARCAPCTESPSVLDLEGELDARVRLLARLLEVDDVVVEKHAVALAEVETQRRRWCASGRPARRPGWGRTRRSGRSRSSAGAASPRRTRTSRRARARRRRSRRRRPSGCRRRRTRCRWRRGTGSRSWPSARRRPSPARRRCCPCRGCRSRRAAARVRRRAAGGS